MSTSPTPDIFQSTCDENPSDWSPTFRLRAQSNFQLIKDNQAKKFLIFISMNGITKKVALQRTRTFETRNLKRIRRKNMSGRYLGRFGWLLRNLLRWRKSKLADDHFGHKLGKWKKTDLKLIGPEFSEARIRRRGPRPCRWRCCRLQALGAERRGLWWLHPDKTCRRPVEEDPVRNSIMTCLWRVLSSS